MLNKKWIAGAVLAAFLTVGVGTSTPQAYAGERHPAAVQTAAVDTVELGRHHRDHRPPKHVDRHPSHGPKHIDHRGHGPRDRHQPPPRHRSHDSGNAIVGGIIGGIIGGILVNSAD